MIKFGKPISVDVVGVEVLNRLPVALRHGILRGARELFRQAATGTLR